MKISNAPADAVGAAIAVVSDTVHAFYKAAEMYYRRSTDAGNTWGENVVLADSLGGTTFNRPVAAHHSRVFFVWGHNDGSGAITEIRMRRSTDGGNTWLNPQILLVAEYAFEYYAPMVAACGNNVYVVFQHSLIGSSHTSMIRSTDDGATWEPIRQITSSGGPIWGDLACFDQSVHLVFPSSFGFSSTEIVHTFSSDNGETWSSATALSTLDDYRAWEPELAVDEGGVYLCWQDEKYGSTSGFSGTVLFRSSTDGGASWSGEKRVSSLPSAIRSSIAVGDVLGILWQDERFGFLDGTIQFTFSTDGGSDWYEDVAIGDTLDVNLGAPSGLVRGSTACPVVFLYV